MSVRFFHNPDHVQTVSKARRHWTTGHVEVTLNDNGYNSTRAYTASNAAGYLYKLLAVDDTVNFRCGLRFKLTSLPAAAKIVLGVVNDDGNLQVGVAINTDGTLSVCSGSTATVLATSTEVVATDTWYRLGLSGRISATTGAAEVHLDSTSSEENVVAFVDTANTAPHDPRTASGLYVGVAPGLLVGHVYYLDGTAGLIHGAFVRYALPGSDGFMSDWTPNTGAVMADVTDDPDPDDDTTYIYGENLNDQFSLTMDAITTAATAIRAAQVTLMAQNAAGATFTGSLQPLVSVDGSSSYLGAVQGVNSADWRAIRTVWELNPQTGVAWAIADVNGSEWGGRLK